MICRDRARTRSKNCDDTRARHGADAARTGVRRERPKVTDLICCHVRRRIDVERTVTVSLCARGRNRHRLRSLDAKDQVLHRRDVRCTGGIIGLEREGIEPLRSRGGSTAECCGRVRSTRVRDRQTRGKRTRVESEVRLLARTAGCRDGFRIRRANGSVRQSFGGDVRQQNAERLGFSVIDTLGLGFVVRDCHESEVVGALA